MKNGRYFELKFPGKPIFNKKELSDVSAIYHQYISITTEAKIEIVLKRPELRDRAITQFNPIFLLASKAKIEV